MRKLVPILLCAALVAGCSSDDPKSAAPTASKQKEALKGSPAPLAELHAQSNQLLGGGTDAYAARLAKLEGRPVVVNKWASWCGPCRAEFPYFQSQSIERGKKIAFVGVNANDNDADAKAFLKKYPVSFPSYTDPDLKISAEMKAVAAFPSTTFYGSDGQIAHVRQGGYATEEKLVADIRKYAR